MTRLPRPWSPIPWSALLRCLMLLLTGTLPLMATATASAAPAPRAAAAHRAQNCNTAPSGDAFYVPPKPLPRGPHGGIIWCRPSVSPVTGATAWQILYLSTTVSGARTAVSGTVLVPAAAFPGTRPVVAYASGTQGWGDQCAASKEMAAGNFDEQFAVNNLLSKGWAVVVTDYPGLGTPGDEAYNVGIPEGYAVLDSLRAATLLPGSGLSTAAPLAIEGYSQGGGAADWAAQLQPSYAPGLALAGVAAGGTPADRAALAQLDTMCQAQGLVTYAGKSIQDYTVGGINPISEPKWQAVLDANNLGGTKPHVPLLEYHGLQDEVIPYSVESALHSQYCAMGVTTQLNGYIGDHVLTQVVAQTDVVTWISNRFAGLPAPSNC